MERIRPREIIADPSLFLQQFLTRKLSSAFYLEQYSASAFLPESAKDMLKRHFVVASLSGFGMDDSPYAVSAAGALMRYLDENAEERAFAYTRNAADQPQELYGSGRNHTPQLGINSTFTLWRK
jgi:DNA mismatch repair protein MutS